LAVLVGVTGASDFAVLDGGEPVAFYLAYVGLVYLVWFALHAARGRYVPPLQERQRLGHDCRPECAADEGGSRCDNRTVWHLLASVAR
jgi:threonine/homoserine/homoserine lactone efflux protein